MSDLRSHLELTPSPGEFISSGSSASVVSSHTPVKLFVSQAQGLIEQDTAHDEVVLDAMGRQWFR
jgi:hypothetical protein